MAPTLGDTMTHLLCRLTGHRRVIHASNAYLLGRRWTKHEAHACWCGAVSQWVTRHG